MEWGVDVAAILLSIQANLDNMPKTQKFLIFRSNGTWRCPGPNTKVHVITIAGGGGGGNGASNHYSSASGNAGGTSAFGALLSVAGGSGGVCHSDFTSHSGENSYRNPGRPGYMGFGRGGDGSGPYKYNVDGERYTEPGRPGEAGATGQYIGEVSEDQYIVVGPGGTRATYQGDNMASDGQRGAVLIWWEE